jgi:hypothetical protein
MAVRLGDDRQVCHRLLQRLALARRAIVGICFPPIPWPMTELEAAADHFNWEERDKLQEKWDAMDAEDAEGTITISLQEELQAEVTESTDGECAAV